MDIRPPKPRALIDRKKLAQRLDTIATELSGKENARNMRTAVLQLFKDALQIGRIEVRRRFDEEQISGREAMTAMAYLVDQLIRALYDFACQHADGDKYRIPLSPDAMAVVATGGYGRGGLAPYSDIDLMFLLPRAQTKHEQAVIEYLLYMLWDLGLKVGHATRKISEAIELAKTDVTIQTSLLDVRFLWGDEALFAKFKKRFEKDILDVGGSAFVNAKLEERDARLQRMGDTRYLLEPNIKEGKGGLRDLQTLMWIAKFLYRTDDVDGLVARGVFTDADASRFLKAEDFLSTVRCHLHFQADRADEVVDFNMQKPLAKRMGYVARSGVKGVERFMKHYFLVTKDVGDLTRTLCAVLEDQHQKKRRGASLLSFPFRSPKIEGFRVDGMRLNTVHEDDFAKDPVKILRLFREAQTSGLDIHPSALRQVDMHLKRINAKVRKNPEANRLFMDMLCDRKDPAATLLRLNEAGVFGRFIPDFGRVVAQMQYDMYHVYTVDEHTIRAIDILSRIERGVLADDHPVSTKVFRDVQSRQALYAAVMLHDIAKGRGGDHSELGAEVAKELCPRLGLNEWETETVSWLVLHHLDMSRTAFKRDLEDPKTIADFVERVQSPERLRLLLILTVVDIRAVGPGVWNGWKAQLLRDLFFAAQDALTGGQQAAGRSSRAEQVKSKLDVLCQEQLPHWLAPARAQHLESGNPGYWLAYDMGALLAHAQMISAAQKNNASLAIETQTDELRDVTTLTVYAPDHPGLFAGIAGALSLSGANIVDAKVNTMANGMALDTFWIQNIEGAAFKQSENLERMRKRIEQALSGELSLQRELAGVRKTALPTRMAAFQVPPRVMVDNNASRTHTVIEINGRNRPGLLFDVTRALTALGLQISSAHISTYGERVVDVFYVKNIFGLKVDQETKIEQIHEDLLEAIART